MLLIKLDLLINDPLHQSAFNLVLNKIKQSKKEKYQDKDGNYKDMISRNLQIQKKWNSYSQEWKRTFKHVKSN